MRQALLQACAATCLLVGIAGCGTKDNSASTDKASAELREAQAKVRESSQDIATNTDEIGKQERELATEQQQLAARQQLLAQQRDNLGSAQETLQAARAVYASAVNERLAKLDASLASFSTKTDAKSRDAAAGLRARRDRLAIKLAGMAATADPGWSEYTKDVDTTFDAIEHDLSDAKD